MANRKGVFIGAYVPNELKESLRRRADDLPYVPTENRRK